MESCFGLLFSFVLVPAEIFRTLAFDRRGVFSRGSSDQVEGCSDTHSEFSLGRAECRIRSVLAGLNDPEVSPPVEMLKRVQKIKTCFATQARESINHLSVHTTIIKSTTIDVSSTKTPPLRHNVPSHHHATIIISNKNTNTGGKCSNVVKR